MRGRYSTSSRRSPRPSVSAHSRSDERKSPTNRATASRFASWNAWRNGLGSRLPKKLPVWVMRKRRAGVYSSPAKSSKSQPFEMTRTAPRAPRPRTSSAIASETHVTASALARDEAGDLLAPRPGGARAAVVSSRRCWLATSGSRRSAIQRAPVAFWTAAPTKCTDGGGDVVITTSMPSRRTIRIAAGIAVRFQVTLASGRSSRRAVTCAWTSARSNPSAARELLRGLPRPWAEVAGAMNPRLRGHAQLGIAMCTHFGSSGASTCVSIAERGQVLRELERALHAAAARGREVHRHEQHLHGREA